MGILSRIGMGREASRSDITLSDYVGLLNSFQFQGQSYPLMNQSMGYNPAEEIGSDFVGVVNGAYKRNGVVFACMLSRMLLFAEARFQYQRLQAGRPGDLFGDKSLGILEAPWPNGTTGDLLSRAIQDADLAGNAYVYRRGNRLVRLRPDWMTIVLGSQDIPDDPAYAADAEILGYLYHPGGRGAGYKPNAFLASEVAHFAPIPDPDARFRGMSWLTPIIREIQADQVATTHKLKFFENGATPNIAVKLDPLIQKDMFDLWVKAFKEQTEGLANAYKTLYLGGGADVSVVGADLKQIDFKVTQGAGETRIAAAAGVPPVIVGLSEGLQAATYSNYAQARRRFADGTMRPLWRNMAGSLQTIIPAPAGSRLWYDDRDIPALREDEKDAAEIQQTQAVSIKQLIDAGYEPRSVVAAVTSGDLARLTHTGLFSVQLQPPGTQLDGKPAPPPQVKQASIRGLLEPFITPEA